MKFLRNLLMLALVTAALSLGVLFAVQNTTPVPLDLLLVSLAERPLAVWVLLAFAAGGLAGLLAGGALVMRLRVMLRRTRRQLAEARSSAERAAIAQQETRPAAGGTDSPGAGAGGG